MSLITEALQRVGGPPPAGGSPPTPGKPKWLLAAAAAVAGLLVVFIPRPSHRIAGPQPLTLALTSAPSQASKPNLGLNLLRSAESQWRLSGVIAGGQGKSLALINQQVVEEGGTIGRAKVIRVSQGEVDLEENGEIRTIKLE